MTGEQHERAVEAIDPNGSAYGLSPWGLDQLIGRYLASLREQGVRLVEQPKCPRCNGRGTLGGATQSAIVEPWTCPRCDGTGYVRLVDLREVLDTIRVETYGEDDPLARHARVVADFLERRFGGNEGSGT